MLKQNLVDQRALILTPTRELAEQIYGVLEPLARVDLTELDGGAMYGGVSYQKQFRALERGCGCCSWLARAVCLI